MQVILQPGIGLRRSDRPASGFWPHVLALGPTPRQPGLPVFLWPSFGIVQHVPGNSEGLDRMSLGVLLS